MGMTIEEYTAEVVARWAPLTAEQIEAAARILASVEPDEERSGRGGEK